MDLQDATEKNRFVVKTVKCAIQGFLPLLENIWELQMENLLELLFNTLLEKKSALTPTVIMICKFP